MTYVAVAELDPVVQADLFAAAVGVPYTPPSVWYVAALTGLPTSDVDTGTECAGSGYVRALVSPQPLMTLVAGVWQNASDIIFAPATAGDWPDIVGFCAFDDPSAGQRQWFAPLPSPAPVPSGDKLRIPAGALTFVQS